MRFFAKRSKLLLALLPIIAVVFYMLTYSPDIKASVTYKPVNRVDNIVELMPVPESGSPADYSPLENVAIANYILTHASYFEGQSVGSVLAKVGFINYNQNVYGARKRKDNALWTQSISSSSMKSVAEQQYISGNTYLYRPGSKVKGNSAEFGAVYQTNADSYLNKYGMPPMELCKYVLKAASVVEQKVISFPADGNGDYVFGFTADPALATEYYQNEVRTLSGSSSEYPQFDAVSFEITIGSDWTPKSFKVNEVYWIDKPVKAACTATLTETFAHVNDPQDIPEAEPFLSFVPKDDGSGGEYVPPTDPTDYLAAAFSKYIAGEPLYLNADISVPTFKFNLNAKIGIDLETKYADVLLEDALYIGYRGDTVYIQAGNLRCKLSTDKFVELAPELLAEAKVVSPKLAAFIADFDFGIFKSDDIMDMLFADSKVITTETRTQIVMPFMLSGVQFDIDMNLTPEPHELESIDAELSVLTVSANVFVTPCAKPAFPSLEGYTDLTAAADFLIPALKTAEYKTFELQLGGSFTTPYYSDGIDGTLALNRVAAPTEDDPHAETVTMKGNIALTGKNVSLRVTYTGGAIYLSAFGANVKFTDEQFRDLLPASMPDLSNIDLTKLDLSKFDLAAMLSAVTELSVKGKVLTAKLEVNGAPIAITLRHDDKTLTAMTVKATYTTKPKDGKAQTFAVDLHIDLTVKDTPVPVVAPTDFLDGGKLVEYIKPLAQMVAQKGETILSITDTTVFGVSISGNVRIALDPVYMTANLTVNSVPVTAAVSCDSLEAIQTAPVALKINNNAFKTTVNRIKPIVQELLQTFGVTTLPALPSLDFAVTSIDLSDTLRVELTVGGMPLCLEAVIEKDKTTVTIGETVEGEATARVAATLTVTHRDTASSRPVLPSDATDLDDALALIKAGLKTVEQAGFTLKGELEFCYDDLKDKASYTLLIDRALNFKLDFTLVNMGIGGTVTKVGGDYYISAMGLQVKIPAKTETPTQTPTQPVDAQDGGTPNGEQDSTPTPPKKSVLPQVIADLLPTAVVALINGEKATLSEYIDLVAMLQTLSIKDGNVSLVAKTDKLNVSVDGTFADVLKTAKVSLTVPRATETDPTRTAVTLKALGALTVGTVTVAAPEHAADYLDVTENSILNLFEGKTLSTDIYMTVNAGESDTITITGELLVAVRNGMPELQLTARAFDTDVTLVLYDQKLYLSVGSLKLTLDWAQDQKAFLDFVNNSLPPFVGALVKQIGDLDIQGMLGGAIVKDDSNFDVDGFIRSLDFTDNKIAFTVRVGKADMRVTLPIPKAGKIAKAELNFNVNQTDVNIRLGNEKTLLVGNVDYEKFDLTPPDAETYVDLMQFAAFLPPIKDTFTAKGFDLTLTEDFNLSYIGKVYAADKDGLAYKVTVLDENGKDKVDKEGKPVTAYATVDAEQTFTIGKNSTIQIIPEGSLGSFVNFKANLLITYDETVVGIGKKVQSRRITDLIQATLVKENGKPFVYIDYTSGASDFTPAADSLKLKVSYAEVMGMLGYAKNILGLEGTVLDRLTKDYTAYFDSTLDTKIFDAIKSSGMQADLVKVLNKVEKALNVLEGYKTKTADGKEVSHDGIFTSINGILAAETLGDATTHIGNIKTSLADNGFAKEKPDESIAATVGNVIRSLGKITLSFDEKLLTISAPFKIETEDETTNKNAAPTETPIQSITLGHNGKTLTTLNINNFSAGKIQIGGGLSLKVTDNNYKVTVTPPDNVETFKRTVDNNGNVSWNGNARTLWNDLGAICPLFKSFINTANLGKFHIGGANNTEYGSINLKIPDILNINITIPYVLKVDFDAKNKPMIYFELNLQAMTGIGGGTALDKNVSRLYYYDGKFLLSRTKPWERYIKKGYTRNITATEFVYTDMQDIFDSQGNIKADRLMQYVYFLLPLRSDVLFGAVDLQKIINDAIAAGITQDFNDKSRIFSRVAYSKLSNAKSEFAAELDVGELARISALDEASVKLTTSGYVGANGKTVDYFDTLYVDMWVLKEKLENGIGIVLNGNLVKPAQDVGKISYMDWTNPTDRKESWLIYHYGLPKEEVSIAQLPEVMKKLSAFTDVTDKYSGTIDHPYVNKSCRKETYD